MTTTIKVTVSHPQIKCFLESGPGHRSPFFYITQWCRGGRPVSKTLLAAAQYFCKTGLGGGQARERGGGTGMPTIKAEDRDQCNWRALKTGDTASCQESRAGIQFVQNGVNQYYCSNRIRKLSFLGTFYPVGSAKIASAHDEFRGWPPPPCLGLTSTGYLISPHPTPNTALVPGTRKGEA